MASLIPCFYYHQTSHTLLPPTRNFIELSLASTRTYGSMKTLGLISCLDARVTGEGVNLDM